MRDTIDIRSKAALVYTIVDVVIRPLVRGLDLVFEILGQEVQLLVLLRQEIIEFGIEHANDLAALIAHDLLLLLVIQRWNGETA